MVTIEQFKEIDLRVGKVVEATPHPNADRLLVLKVDIGEPQPRQLVAGIKKSYTPEVLVGKFIVVLANLQPAQLRGVESQGMALAVQCPDAVTLVTIDQPIASPGTRVT
jgi:methionyl-tRNA synthetase